MITIKKRFLIKLTISSSKKRLFTSLLIFISSLGPLLAQSSNIFKKNFTFKGQLCQLAVEEKPEEISLILSYSYQDTLRSEKTSLVEAPNLGLFKAGFKQALASLDTQYIGEAAKQDSINTLVAENEKKKYSLNLLRLDEDLEAIFYDYIAWKANRTSSTTPKAGRVVIGTKNVLVFPSVELKAQRWKKKLEQKRDRIVLRNAKKKSLRYSYNRRKLYKIKARISNIEFGFPYSIERFDEKISSQITVFKPVEINLEIFQGTIRNIEVKGDMDYYYPTDSIYREVSRKYANDVEPVYKALNIIYEDIDKSNSRRPFLLENKRDSLERKLDRAIITFNKELREKSTLRNCPMTFRNKRPIPISSIRDAEYANRESSILLYSIGGCGKDTTSLYEASILNSNSGVLINEHYGEGFAIKYSSVMKYEPINQYDSDDYSPRDDTYEFKDFAAGENFTLEKEEQSQILTARIFSDFIGLTDDQPNGLIQTEVGKRVKLTSPRKAFYGFNYIEPTLTFSKIEENQRILDLSTLSDTSNLELFRFNNLQYGFKLNLLGYTFPHAKFVANLNTGLHLNRTLVAGSEGEEASAINSLFLEIVNTEIRFRPDTRYGFSIAHTWGLFDTKSELVRKRDSQFHTFSLSGFYAPNRLNVENQLFFRFNANFENTNWDKPFVQAQLGYQISLTNRKKTKPVPKEN